MTHVTPIIEFNKAFGRWQEYAEQEVEPAARTTWVFLRDGCALRCRASA